MKEYVAKRSRKGVPMTDIIAINGMAKKDAAAGNKVINASIGTFLDEDKKLGSIKLINDALTGHITENLGYPNSIGDPDYLNAVMDYVFREKLTRINELYTPFIGATLGGTGAISISFNCFLEEGDLVLLPDVMWTNYMLVAEKAHAGFATYNMFTPEGKLDLTAIKETIAKAREQGHRALLVINDPCQNPTGYCMDEKEYDELFALLNEEGRKGYLTVLFDIAYFSFYRDPGHKLALFDKLVESKPDFLPLVCFSCSKLFCLYGLRLGALIVLCPNAENRAETERAFSAMARGTYSVSVGAAQHAVATLLKDKSVIASLDAEIERNSDVLYSRSVALINELDKVGIQHYPYKSGFFITLKVPHAFDVYETLKAKHMYIVPMTENSIRLALSGMTEDEIIVLIHAIADAMVK
ncbi:MAG: aminotransferase class I/II-fold pyridoxal phosphate-dependent enzyme [Bacilli bacterium]|nr:aminotransferase class I/II-fold pyridoxal phosphate-dependent enzyme [Bacilli bacterium]